MTRENNLKTYREIINNFLGNKCNKCNSKEKLHIHHKDGFHKNNEIDNIEILCSKCHYEHHRNIRKKISDKIDIDIKSSKIKSSIVPSITKKKIEESKITFKNEPKIRTAEREYLFIECPKCPKKVWGRNKKEVTYNYEIHNISCKKKFKGDKK